MMDKTFLFFDVLTAAAILVSAYIGSRKGFLRMILSLLIYIAAFLGASFVSDSFSEPVYHKYIKEEIVSAAEESIDKFSDEINEKFGISEEKDTADSSLPDSAKDSIIEEIIEKFLERYGIKKDPSEIYDEDINIISEILSEPLSDGAGRRAAEYLEEKFVRKSLIRALEYLLWSVSFMILFTLLKVLMRFILSIRSIGAIRSADSLLGAVAGVAEGVLILIAASVFIKLFISFAGENSVLSETLINDTLIYKYIYNLI